MKTTTDLVLLLDNLQTIARNGLHYTDNFYDRERYENLLSLTTQVYGDWLDTPPDAIRDTLLSEMGQITPKVGADGAIFNDDGEVLLMDRADGSGWCLPCGWLDVGERPSQATIREVREETGLHVKIERLVGVFTRLPHQSHSPHTMIAIVHLCKVIGGELTLSHEGLDLRYWPLDDVPCWHATHETYARAAYEMWASKQWLPAISN